MAIRKTLSRLCLNWKIILDKTLSQSQNHQPAFSFSNESPSLVRRVTSALTSHTQIFIEGNVGFNYYTEPIERGRRGKRRVDGSVYNRGLGHRRIFRARDPDMEYDCVFQGYFLILRTIRKAIIITPVRIMTPVRMSIEGSGVG